MNPDRAEFGSRPTSVPENPRKNSHIPSWAKGSVFVARTFLAVLTASPGAVVAADTIYHTANPSIAYADGGATGKLLSIERLEDCRWDIHMEVNGLRSGSPVRMFKVQGGDSYDCTGVKDQSIGYTMGESMDMGIADSSGQISIDYIQSQYGRFRFFISDDYDVNLKDAADHVAMIEVTYSKSEIPINTQTPALTKTLTPRPTSTYESTNTPEPSTPELTNTPKPSDTPKPPDSPTPSHTPNAAATAVAWETAAAELNAAAAKEIADRRLALTPTSDSDHQPPPTPRPTIPEIRPTPFVPEDSPNTPQGIPIWLWGLGAGAAGFVGSRLYRKWRG